MRVSSIVYSVLLLVVPGSPGVAQDVELLAERYGTALPDGYRRTVRADPEAFRFVHGRAARLRVELAEAGGDMARIRSLPAGPRPVIGPREGPVTGTFRIPVVLGLFSDSPAAPFTAEAIQEAYFGEASGSITAYYAEASRGLANLVGDVQQWVQTDRTRAETTGGESGLVSGTVGPFIKDLLERLPEMDWGLYDNDGPDGLPNSGDDDGFVDALAVLHPTRGAECGGSDQDDRVWSHRWTLTSASGSPYVTGSAAAIGGFIRIDDYVIQPTVSCTGGELSEIGVFTHELGHAFGLPDLYDTYPDNGKHSGAGNWDLMATGSWGCDSHSPERPCHLGAWSKAVLGWVDVVPLAPDTDHGAMTIPPVQTSGTVFRVDGGDGSGEYFLLENRQRQGFDLKLPAAGLLIWHIDPSAVAARWPVNTINGFQRMGVWLRQADGLNQLGVPGSGRGDANDPFPQEGALRENRVFHAAAQPSARTHDDVATGTTITDIRRVGDNVELRLSTRFSRITVSSTGDTGSGGLFSVDGVGVPEPTYTFLSAPFDERSVEAAPGDPIEDGVRRPFLRWLDDAQAPRVRTLETPMDDLALTAEYGGRQVELSIVTMGGVNDIEPATYSTQPPSDDLWFDDGALVTVEAVTKTGFDFLGWTGALAGQPNPATVSMLGPVHAGASFLLTYTLSPTTVNLTAAVTESVQLEPENGNPPFTWWVVQGALPRGLALDNGGTVRGAAVEVGSFPLTLEVWDAIGLTARGEVTLVVAEPTFSTGQLASPFLLSGEPLDPIQTRFLDTQGNGNGAYDLGDFRAWILAHPGLPLSAPLRALVAPPRTVRIPMVADKGRGSVR
jgi:M6 family metalloprotease-like protein